MRYYWNDKEVSEEEYQALDASWKKSVEDEALQEKILQEKSQDSKKSVRKKVT
jgi:tripartite-type tricarboxylate transporter receptor subunit TctC